MSVGKKPMLTVVGGTDAIMPRDDLARQTSFRASDERPSEALSITAKNGRLRSQRREAWRLADAVTSYWRRRLDFDSAVSLVQQWGAPEGNFHPDVEHSSRIPMVRRYREALVKQLLTPAPDNAAVNWKQAALARGQHHHIDVGSELIERAIADDVAWLAAHPFRIKARVSVS